MKHTKCLTSARMRDALYNLRKEIARIRNPHLPAIEIESDSLQGGVVKTLIPSNVTDIYTRLEIFLGLDLSKYTDTLAEASNLCDELYKQVVIQNQQQYQNALDKFSSH